MARRANHHLCSACGSATARWAGRCPACGEWNTLVERAGGTPSRVPSALPGPAPGAVPLASVGAFEAEAVPTGVCEFDRVLAGGLTPGSVTLLGGEPGIGKSTLVLQVLAARAAAGGPVLLISAEESASQVRLRAGRLGPIAPGLLVQAATDVDASAEAIVACEPQLVVVDSIQAMAAGPPEGEGRPTGAPGSVGQVRECARRLIELAKSRGVAIVLVGHVTKDGSLAGPRALEHMVDTVLSFEGDRHHALRLLSAVKHRFGPTGELGLFEMCDQGLERVEDPGRLLLGDRLTGVPGNVVLPALQGRRALAVELQALVTPMAQGQAKRSAVGLDAGRLAMILAVLARHAALALLSKDVFVSVAGGIRVAEPAADLAVAVAVASAELGFPLPEGLAAVGEVGLAGEVRQVSAMARRLDEIARMGFDRMLVPASSPAGPPGVELVRVDTVADAVALAGSVTRGQGSLRTPVRAPR